MSQPGEVDEKEVVENLLLSTEFRGFYDKERPRAGHIKWCYNPNLRKQYAADAMHIADPDMKCKKIILTRFPVNIEDAHIVAHEIVHAIFSEEKNTVIIYERPKPNPSLRPYLGSMLEDPLVDTLLCKKYNFDLSRDYLRGILILEDEFKNWREPENPLNRLGNAFNLANQMVCWRLIEDPKMRRRWDNFLVWYSDPNRCPSTSQFARELVAIMDHHKLETLDQRRMVCSEVIEKYHLEKNLDLKNKFHVDLQSNFDECP